MCHRRRDVGSEKDRKPPLGSGQALRLQFVWSGACLGVRHSVLVGTVPSTQRIYIHGFSPRETRDFLCLLIRAPLVTEETSFSGHTTSNSSHESYAGTEFDATNIYFQDFHATDFFPAGRCPTRSGNVEDPRYEIVIKCH